MSNTELKNTKTEDLIFDDSKKTNTKGETILGTFEGPCADIIDGTRNGRHYSEQLWKKVFNDPIVQELFECGGILGELDHPADREETKTSEVAICMSEPPVKGPDGLLYGKWDILDTPNGRIAATLAKYGYKFGISSRGSGDTSVGPNGNEEVDPETYDFQAFDLVILPAVKKARLTFKEGMEKDTLQKALTESLSKATPDERLIMENTLGRLNINLNESSALNDDVNTTSVVNINEGMKNTTVDNNEADILSELQESLDANQKLENKIVNLQEKLSACYTRESDQEAEIAKYKKAISKLTPYVNQVKALEEKLNKVTQQLDESRNTISAQQKKLSSDASRLATLINTRNSLKESIANHSKQSELLKVNSSRELSKKQEEIISLKESLAEAKKDQTLKQKEYKAKLENCSKLVEKYKKIANKAVDRYIESQAVKIGVNVNEIKNKLPSSYTFQDIDSICESLQEYKLNMNKLPFRRLVEHTQAAAVTSPKQNSIIPANTFDDDVDEGLISLAGLK